MYQSMAEAFRSGSGVKAVVEEHMLFLKPFGFSFEHVPLGKLVIWHGEDDITCRVTTRMRCEVVKQSFRSVQGKRPLRHV
jgi:hypothetical protein